MYTYTYVEISFFTYEMLAFVYDILIMHKWKKAIQLPTFVL